MTAYILAEISIHDRSRYGEYESGFMTPELGAAMARTSARFIAVDEAQVSLEGEHPHTRTVLVEFPDAEAARGFTSPRSTKRSSATDRLRRRGRSRSSTE